MKEILAYCGLVCSDCPVYAATVEKDEERLAALAEEYSSEACQFTAEELRCEGCFAQRSDGSKMCGDCPMRSCGKEKGVENCGTCREYPCGKIETMVEGDSRKRLDAIHEKCCSMK